MSHTYKELMSSSSYSYTSKKWFVFFYCEIINGEIQTDCDGNPIVNIKLSTKPEKYLHFTSKSSSSRFLVLLIKETTQSKFFSLEREINEVCISGSEYLLEPLSQMIQRHAKQVGFTAYKIGNVPETPSKPKSRLVEPQNALSELLLDDQ